jgi:hypothetical protein
VSFDAVLEVKMRARRKLLSIFLLLTYPATISLAEMPSGMLYATGSVMLNGAAVRNSSSVFAGDRVVTASSSVASITRSGSSVIVDPNSSVLYEDYGFKILDGTARASTRNGLTAHAGPISVVPKNKLAKFDVSTHNGTILIASREGVLTLTDGDVVKTLEPGYTASIRLGPEQDKSQNPIPAATTSGVITGSKQLIIVIAAAAVGATAIACSLACTDGGAVAVSPVTP